LSEEFYQRAIDDAVADWPQRFTTASLRQAIHRAADKAGVPRWNPNQLRHARATLLRKLKGIEAARVQLGHAAVKTTEIYAERDLEAAMRLALEFG
jgi:integrase